MYTICDLITTKNEEDEVQNINTGRYIQEDGTEENVSEINKITEGTAIQSTISYWKIGK